MMGLIMDACILSVIEVGCLVYLCLYYSERAKRKKRKEQQESDIRSTLLKQMTPEQAHNISTEELDKLLEKRMPFEPPQAVLEKVAKILFLIVAHVFAGLFLLSLLTAGCTDVVRRP